MNPLLYVIITTLIAGVGGTGLGGVISALIRKDTDKLVSLLLSFAGGIMLAIVCFDMMPGAMTSADGQPQPLYLIVAGILLGYVLVALLNWLIDKQTNHEIKHIDKSHPQTADALDELIHSDHYQEHKKANSQLFIAGAVMAAAIALHNLPEGMVIGAAYAGNSASGGLLVAVVIGLHNIPEGMAVGVPLIAGGMPRWKAVLTTAMSGLPTVIGAVIGYLLGALSPVWLALSLSFASGAMLYVVFGELLPEAILMWRSKLPAAMTLAGILIGLLVIYI